MTPQERLEKLNFKIEEAHKVIEVAEQSGNPIFLEKARKALEQHEEMKKELLASFSLEQFYGTKVPEEFQLNLGISGQGNPGPATEEVEEYDEFPPHLKR